MHTAIISTILLSALFALGLPLSGQSFLQDDKNPKVLEVKAPHYPTLARAAHATGSAIVEVEIGSDGRVISTRLISGLPLFVKRSRDAAMAWRFEASPNPSSIRKVSLTFEFSPNVLFCTHISPFTTVTPYHLLIAPDPPADTVSYLPADAKAKSCRVHGTRMLPDKVEIIYGLIATKKDAEEAEQKHFPNANPVAFGGCLIEVENCNGSEMQLSPKYAELLFCSKCRMAQARWIKAHQKTIDVTARQQ